jgi:hypothetical protein
MRPPVTLFSFGMRAVSLFIVLMVVWMQVSTWTSYPAASLAKSVLDNYAKDWIRSTQYLPDKLVATTKFQKAISASAIASVTTEVVVSRYTYGTVLFVSLIIASGSRQLLRRILAGYAILLIPQAFSLAFILLGQILMSIRLDLLVISSFQADATSACYTFGILVLPTLAPVALWLWFEQKFCVTIIGAWTSGVDKKAYDSN